MTRGIAPLVLGYQAFDKAINIQGVILNQVGGSRHEDKLRAILEHYTDVHVLGAVHKDSLLNIDERHLGLIPSNEEHLADQKIKYIADRVKEQVNLEELLLIAATAQTPDLDHKLTIEPPSVIDSTLKIGIFRDESFGFYYPDDLEAMTSYGAELVFIDSAKDHKLPPIDGLFIGGGFPETQMQALQDNHSLKESVKEAIENGLPAYAECGGLMYLSRSITWNDEKFDMVGVIQGDIVMHKKPQGRGYIKLEETRSHPWDNTDREKTIFAHEFHYSELVNVDVDYPHAYKVLRGTGIDGKHDGLIYKNLLANYAHLRNTNSNHWVKRFVQFISQTKNSCHSLASTSITQN
jgi:cobyrinic acid a,c-diamide synthase